MIVDRRQLRDEISALLSKLQNIPLDDSEEETETNISDANEGGVAPEEEVHAPQPD